MSADGGQDLGGTLARIQALVTKGAVRFTRHGLSEMASDRITIDDVLNTLPNARVVEDYPDATRGPTVLTLQVSPNSRQTFHVVWGIEMCHDGPAVVITVYRPDPSRWSADFMRRLQ